MKNFSDFLHQSDRVINKKTGEIYAYDLDGAEDFLCIGSGYFPADQFDPADFATYTGPKNPGTIDLDFLIKMQTRKSLLRMDGGRKHKRRTGRS